MIYLNIAEPTHELCECWIKVMVIEKRQFLIYQYVVIVLLNYANQMIWIQENFLKFCAMPQMLNLLNQRLSLVLMDTRKIGK